MRSSLLDLEVLIASKTDVRIRYTVNMYKEYTCQQCGKTFKRESRFENYKEIKHCSFACNGKASRKHGMSKHPLYKKFSNIQRRCESPQSKDYKRYGARGIKCLWKDFESFYADMGESYFNHVSQNGQKNTQIDRIDNDGHYCKKNCHWVTPRQNAYNRSNNRTFTVKGKEMSLREMSERYSVKLSTLKTRIYVLNWKPEKACNL